METTILGLGFEVWVYGYIGMQDLGLEFRFSGFGSYMNEVRSLSCRICPGVVMEGAFMVMKGSILMSRGWTLSGAGSNQYGNKMKLHAKPTQPLKA